MRGVVFTVCYVTVQFQWEGTWRSIAAAEHREGESVSG